MVRALLATILVASIATSFALLQTDSSRDLDPESYPAGPVPAGAESVDCGRVLSYQQALFSAFDAHRVFMAYWGSGSGSGADVQAMDRDDVAVTVEDGYSLIADLESLAPPAPYADGHDGIIIRFTFEVDYLNFFGIDTSIAPDVNVAQDSLLLMYNGEVAVAEACPDEIDAAGGYIFVDPAVLEDLVNP